MSPECKLLSLNFFYFFLNMCVLHILQCRQLCMLCSQCRPCHIVGQSVRVIFSKFDHTNVNAYSLARHLTIVCRLVQVGFYPGLCHQQSYQILKLACTFPTMMCNTYAFSPGYTSLVCMVLRLTLYLKTQPSFKNLTCATESPCN